MQISHAVFQVANNGRREHFLQDRLRDFIFGINTTSNYEEFHVVLEPINFSLTQKNRERAFYFSTE